MSVNNVTIFAVIAVAAFIVGLSKGGFGGAMGSLVTPLLVLVMPAPVAVGLSLPLLLCGDVFAVSAHWRGWDRKILMAALPSTVVGIFLGILLLDQLRRFSGLLQQILGIAALLYVVYAVWRRMSGRVPVGTTAVQTTVLSGGTGFASTVANAGGPIWSIHLLTLRLTPSVFVATTAIYFMFVNVAKLPFYFASGVLRLDWLPVIAWSLPLVPMGVWTGVKLDKVIDKNAFEIIILFFLAVTGVMLLVNAR